MKTQFIIFLLIGCFISVNVETAFANTNKAALVKALHASAIKGESYVAKEITLKSKVEDVLRKFGTPKQKINDEWGAVFEYNSFSVEFSTYLHDLKNSTPVAEIHIYLREYNILYKDLLDIMGPPNFKQYNEESNEWEIIYKAGDNCLGFYTTNLENGSVGAAIFKPSEELRIKLK